MAEKHKFGRDGLIEDDVSSHLALQGDFDLERLAQASLASFTIPRMYDSRNQHSRLYVAAFDGTGNDGLLDSEHATAVFKTYLQADGAGRLDSRIAAGYVKGPGTQGTFLPRVMDGALGYTYDARVEEMYRRFIVQAATWIEKDPDADVQLLEMGFSRGADQAVGFARMVHERGIQDPEGRKIVRDAHGHAQVKWTKPPLRDPGQTLQHAMLFDPVGTGHPRRHDRRLPPSMASAFQIVARDERRDQFASSQIVPQGLSADGRFLGVTVPGAHSDIGGSYHRNGLALMHRNLAVDYINAGFDRPLFQKDALPADSRMFAIHHSEEHLPIYSTSKFDKDGHRDSMGAQISPPHCRLVQMCAPPEPLDPSLLPMIGPRYPVTIGSVPEAKAESLTAPSINAPSLTAPSVTAPAMAPHPAVAPSAESSRRDDASLAWRNDQTVTPQEKDNSIHFHGFRSDHFNEADNIRVSRDVYREPDTTPPSSLSPVGRAAIPDPVHERALLEQVERINTQVAKELGRPPASMGPTPARTDLPERPVRSDASPSVRPGNIQHLTTRPAAAEHGQPAPSLGSPASQAIDDRGQEPARRQLMSAPAGVPLVSSHASQPQQRSELERSAQDPRDRNHPDHSLFQSINIQVAELHLREGIDVSKEQLDRVSTALLVEAKRNGMRQVTDVEFGQDARGRRTPDLIATEAFRGNPDDVRSRWAGIDASQAIAVPVETSSEQLHAVNQQTDLRMQQQQAHAMSEQQGVSMSR